MNRYKIIVAYDGSDYSGWQLQPDAVTVQSTLELGIKTVTGEAVRLHGSGRTDRGVHAMGQVAHCDLIDKIKPDTFTRSLNAVLPADIRVISVTTVKPDFHARRSAISKEYRYYIWNSDIVPPPLRLYRTAIRNKLDVDAMRSACNMIVGKHDFAAFTANPNRPVESTVRELSMLTVSVRGKEIMIRARSEGFLYKMVRSLVGFLIRVGDGSLQPEDAQAIR
ncbi:MAG: tRNA pseudouridine(38-40) synthase TruA, partial [Lentisphaerae bacterium]|nr:tRNA pseudouridine(38-40) synthase TruA [Lentisphaerota bacterium]